MEVIVKIFATACIVCLVCGLLTPREGDTPVPVACVGVLSILTMVGCAVYAVWAA